MLIPKQAGKAFIGTCLIALPWTWTSCDQAHETQINLIPEPVEMVVQSGYFPIDSTGCSVAGTDLSNTPSIPLVRTWDWKVIAWR